MRTRLRPCVLIINFLIAIGGGFSSTQAQDANVLAAAKREGRVVWYSSVGESQQFAQEFEKKYPFIKVDVVRDTGQRRVGVSRGCCIKLERVST